MNDFVALDLRFFFYILAMIGMMSTFEGLRRLFWTAERDAKVKTARLRKLRGAGGGATTIDQLRKQQDRSILERLPFFGDIPARMRQAGMTLSPRMLIMISALVTSVLYLVAQPRLGVFLAGPLSILVGIFMPMAVVNIFRRRRIESLTKQLPDALDLMRRGLSVGHPLNVTIQNVARTMPDPIASEFTQLSDQVAYGDTLPDAVQDMARRVDQEDMHYLAASVQIQHSTGGDLGEMLGTLASVIRKRYAMRRRIKAVSSEGRISAMILTAMPFVMYGGTLITAPNYYSSVSSDPLFWPMCFAIAFFVIGNGMMLRKLVNFRF